jgi:hypothetical protein
LFRSVTALLLAGEIVRLTRGAVTQLHSATDGGAPVDEAGVAGGSSAAEFAGITGTKAPRR